MSSVFSASSLETGDGNFTAAAIAPISMAAWVYRTTDSVISCVMAVTDTAGDGNYWALMLNAADGVTAEISDAGGTTAANVAGTLSQDTWTHVGYYDDGTNHNCYINGVAGTANASVRAPSGVDNLSIGRLEHNTGSANALVGRVQWPGVWDKRLTDAQFLSLARGKHPITIERANLQSFPPLWAGENFDRVLNIALSANSTVTVGDNPPIKRLPLRNRQRPLRRPVTMRYAAA